MRLPKWGGTSISRSTSRAHGTSASLLRDLDARHRATLAIEVHDSIVMVTDESLPLAPGRILHAAILPWLLGTNDDNARFLASRTQSFSLLEVGSSHGLYALELAARFPNGSFVHLEPNGTAWEAHTALGVSRRLPHALFLRNNITHEVAEALAHSNEFFDAQLLLSLQTTEVFAGRQEVGQEGNVNRDGYVAHLLSLARRTLLLLDGLDEGGQCRAQIEQLERIRQGLADVVFSTEPARMTTIHHPAPYNGIETLMEVRLHTAIKLSAPNYCAHFRMGRFRLLGYEAALIPRTLAIGTPERDTNSGGSTIVFISKKSLFL